MLRPMNKICSAHNLRNERIKYFNLCPTEYRKYLTISNKNYFKYKGQEIPVISSGWTKYGDIEVKLVDSKEGKFNAVLMTYELH